MELQTCSLNGGVTFTFIKYKFCSFGILVNVDVALQVF